MPMTDLTAEHFEQRLEAHRSPEQARSYEGKLRTPDDDVVIGVPMGKIFALAKDFIDMPPAEIERLLDSSIHEARAGALSIMDKQARRKRTPPASRKELYDLYLRRPDRIDSWGLVDLGAPHVIGGYLFDKPRGVLYELARSDDTWQRRTAIVATLFFVRQGDVDDTFAIADILLHDEHDLIQKPTGGLLREAGKKAPERLLAFLDEHAATMPRTTLRYAIERLDDKQRAHYMSARRR
jgi:3-methyladenine DNA glycosylase AlkD